MVIKKYTAVTINKAMSMIKNELGVNAIIISKRMVRQKGIFGFLMPRMVEITAAIDDYPAEKIVYEKESDEMDKNSGVHQEICEVKKMLQVLVDENKTVKKGRRIGIKKLLIERDVNEEVITKIINNIKNNKKYKENTRLTDKVLIDEIRDLIKVDTSKDDRIKAFIGPTGVGKTTTIAKIAAIETLNYSKKVGLITIDTYRIGAVEQLKIYADILGLPFEVVNSLNDIKKSVNNLKECDSILIDTTGRSIKNEMQLSELKLYLNKINPDAINLVMSMTTKYNDSLKILNGFDIMKYNSIILTKFDETSTYGSLVNIACNASVPISYITTGQNVPDDIEEANKEKLLRLIIGEESI